MALAAGGELAGGGELGGVEVEAGVGQRRVVEAGAALGDQPAGVLAGAGEAGADQELQHRNAGVGDVVRRQRQRREVVADAAVLEDIARRRLGGGGGLRPVAERA